MIKNKWLIFSIVVSLYFLSYFYRVSTAIISPDLIKEFKIGAESLGFLSSIYFYTFALAQFPLGPSLDRIGPRKMITILGIVAAIGTIIEHFRKLPDGTYPFIAYKYAFMFAITGMCISLFFYLFAKEK